MIIFLRSDHRRLIRLTIRSAMSIVTFSFRAKHGEFEINEL